LEFAPVAASFLKGKGYNAEVVTDNKSSFDDVDFAVVLGGDGTILRAARQLYGKDIPLFGINFGRLGYLTECSSDDALSGLESVADGSYRLESRMMIEGEIVRDGKKSAEFIALNEISVYRAMLMHALSMEIMINGKHTETVRGDGLIVATPTGSTSYNLSAGGPVLTPTSQNIVITAVAAHNLCHSSIVTDGDDTISAKITYGFVGDKGNAFLEVDGNERYELYDGDIINVRRAKHTAKILKVSDKSFYQTLKEKLSRVD
jgi:NAD+ kinase